MPIRITIAAAFLCLLPMAGPSRAAERAAAPETGPEVELCLSLIRIGDSKILDSQHILFTLTDKRTYLNKLPTRCAGMKPGTTYEFRTTQTSLCNGDIITLLRPGGHYLIPGASCPLGVFRQVTREEIDALKLEEPAH